MEERPRQPAVIRFNQFALDLGTLQLRSSGAITKLQPQPAKVLALLAANPGTLITREQIRQHVWGEETFVDFEQGLNSCIRQIRDVLGDDSQSPRFIETLPRRGYRFLVPFEAEASISPPAAPVLLRIGVMPFAQLAAAAENYLGEGLTEEVMRQLSRLAPGRIRVIARATMAHCRRESMSLNQLQQEVGLDYLLEGTIRHSPDRIRIAVELTDVKDQTLVWADAYERRLTDLFSLQSEVAGRVARSLAVELLPHVAVCARKPANYSPAHEAYLKGRYFFHRMTADSVLAASRYLAEAIAIDPDYAPAYAGLADCYAQMGSIRVALLTSAEALGKAKPMAIRALELDDTLPEAHNALALIKCWYELDWNGAGEAFRHALALDPDNVTHAPWYSVYLIAIGEPERALAEIYRAREIDPLSPIINTYVGCIHKDAGQYDLAIRQLRETIPLDPSYYRPYFFLGHALVGLGQHAEALSALNEARARAPQNLEVIAYIGWAQAKMGDHSAARATLHQLIETAGAKFDTSLFAGIIHTALGDDDVAFDCIERAIERRFSPIYLLRFGPFHTLHRDPRYQSCLRRIGLPPLNAAASAR
jgi:TolB-like protein/Tfp pilus assembly protein PilF